MSRIAPSPPPAAECALEGIGREGPTDTTFFQVPDDTLEASMIFVDFPDAPAVATETPSQNFGQSLVTFAEDWIVENSYGRTRMDVSFDDQWLRMSKPAADYGFADGVTFAEHRAYIEEAVSKADAAGFDFAGRETVYVVAAPSAGDIPISPAFHASTADGIQADGTLLRWGATSGDDVRVPGFGEKVLAHETGHTLGLPDLYHFVGSTHRSVGAWDLMGDLTPGLHTLAWHKLKLGWLAGSQWRCVGAETAEAVLTPSASPAGGVKMLVTAINDSVAYAAEVRTPSTSTQGCAIPAASSSTGSTPRSKTATGRSR